MSTTAEFENYIFSLLDRWWAEHHAAIDRHGIVTAYDPVKYLAKAMLQPEGYETGWLPIETGHIGDNYGIAHGLQPGDGKTTGDQVIVRFQGGDLESGKIVQRVHSEEDTPPPVQSGETVIWTKFRKSGGDDDSAQGGQGGTGQQIYLKNDGSLTTTDGNGASIVLDGSGTLKIKCKNLQIDVDQVMTAIAQGSLGLKAIGTLEVKGGSVGVDASGVVTVQGKGDVADLNVTPPQGQPMIPPFSVPDP